MFAEKTLILKRTLKPICKKDILKIIDKMIIMSENIDMPHKHIDITADDIQYTSIEEFKTQYIDISYTRLSILVCSNELHLSCIIKSDEQVLIYSKINNKVKAYELCNNLSEYLCHENYAQRNTNSNNQNSDNKPSGKTNTRENHRFLKIISSDLFFKIVGAAVGIITVIIALLQLLR